MRIITPETVNLRKKKILNAIVYHYIKTNKAVSSKVIVENYGIELSSATVRNIMAELEKEGYVKHEHISSGCIPTDKGYRNFVDSLTELNRVAYEERRKIMEEFKTRVKEIDEIFLHTSHILAMLSNYIGFVLVSDLSKDIIEQLQIVQIENRKLLFLIITKSGIVHHHIMEINIEIPVETFEELNNKLNDKFRGIAISEFKNRLYEIQHEISNYKDTMLEVIKLLSEDVTNVKMEKKIFLDGVGNIMKSLEIKDYRKITELMNLVEQKKILLEFLEKDMKVLNGIKITIGKEHDVEQLKDLSLIRTCYKIDNNPVGVLGIIGPKRMEYKKMIALVNFIGDMLTKSINKLFKGMKK